jgi:alpha-ketoglutarate-dependent 2,4-dichlorophenoxyacetate dioxygenase
MDITLQPLHDTFVVQVSGVDIANPDSQALQGIAQALDDHSIVVIRGQEISNEQQLAFASHFGTIEPSVTRYRKDTPQRIPQAGIVDVSNLDENDKPREISDRVRMLLLGNRLWHTDSSFRAVPGGLSMLYARQVPPQDGQTEFADTRTAFDSLGAADKLRITDAVAEHSLMHSRFQLGFTDFSQEEIDALPPVQHPLVRTSPANGRRALYIGSHASHIVGMPVPEGRMVLRDLLEHATRRELVYSHEWQVGDLVIWDNRCTLHRGKAYDESFPRDMRRVTTSHTDEISVLESLKRNGQH